MFQEEVIACVGMGEGLQWFCMEGAQRAKNLDSLPEGSGEDSKLDSVRFAIRK